MKDDRPFEGRTNPISATLPVPLEAMGAIRSIPALAGIPAMRPFRASRARADGNRSLESLLDGVTKNCQTKPISAAVEPPQTEGRTR